MEYDDFVQRVLDMCLDKKVIFIFFSKNDEVETRPIMSALLAQGKTVVVPVVKAEKGTLRLCRLTSLEDITIGAYGIYEPKEQSVFPRENIDIFFVPGTAFDKLGNRKGRGKGYFDRFLADVKNKRPIVGLCFENQVVEKLKTNGWDIPVDYVITKKP